eukprot:Sspe_Gene.112697::Locus_95899_Transcript_1_1_Confidence_1.000_Length_1000::g.112697::m.112697/K13119/FAM50, XAP5; protein FAM50
MEANMASAGFRKVAFGKGGVTVDQMLSSEMVGLVTKDEWAARKKELEDLPEKLKKAEEAQIAKQAEKEARRKKKAKKQQKESLSFGCDEEEEEEELDDEGDCPPAKKAKKDATIIPKYGKDPTVDTTFLPCSIRAAEERKKEEERREASERLRQELEKVVFQMPFTTAGPGGGVQYLVDRCFGDTVADLLADAYREDKVMGCTMSSHDLMFVLDGLMIPASTTFYELSVMRDVDDELMFGRPGEGGAPWRPPQGGRVLSRRWYLGNKEKFPHWEAFSKDRRYKRLPRPKGKKKDKDPRKWLDVTPPD